MLCVGRFVIFIVDIFICLDKNILIECGNGFVQHNFSESVPDWFSFPFLFELNVTVIRLGATPPDPAL